MEMSESLLFETTNTVIRLINNFSHKNNISSSNLIRRLDYLFERLADFLSRELNSTWKSIEPSDLSENVVTTQSIPAEAYQPISAPESSANGGINYKCAICDKDITVFNSDMSLSVALHVQEDAHKEALRSKKNVRVGTAKPAVNITGNKKTATVDERKQNDKYDKYVTKKTFTCYNCKFCAYDTKDYSGISNHKCSNEVDGGISFIERLETKYFCKLCSVHTTSIDNMKEHIAGHGHQNNLLKEAKSDTHDSINNSSKVFCSVCCIYIHKKDVKPHIAGRGHQSKLQKGIKDSNIVVVDNDEESYFCKLCSVYIPNLEDTKKHISESKHTIKSFTQTELEASNIVTVTEDSKGIFFCKLCSVYASSIKNLKDHIEGKAHNKLASVYIPNLEDTKKHISESKHTIKSFTQTELEASNIVTVTEDSKGIFFCKLCSVYASSIKNLKDHIEGKAHNKLACLLKQMLDSNFTFVDISKHQYYCNLCSASISSLKCLIEHMEGKTHSENLKKKK